MKAPLTLRRLPRSPRAFSLVEVTIAIGIIAFALIGIIGLLPTGLKSIKNANEQAGAANVLNGIADALRDAETTNGSIYTFYFAGVTNTYTVGAASGVTSSWTDLNLDGNVVANNEAKRLSARLEIKAPPADASTPGRAVVSVAWSAMSGPEWNGTNWTKADGSLTSGIQFLPRQ